MKILCLWTCYLKHEHIQQKQSDFSTGRFTFLSKGGNIYVKHYVCNIKCLPAEVCFACHLFCFQRASNIHSVHPPPPPPPPPPPAREGGWRLSLLPNWEKGVGHDRTLIFRGGFWEREEGGSDLFEGGCNFYIKNKLKSKTFNDKKSW